MTSNGSTRKHDPARRQLLRMGAGSVASACALAGGWSAHAATWPSRTVRIVLPFPAGGTSDVVARLLAQKLTASLQQTVIVDSKPGANGIIASDAVAKSAADGHTLLFASAAHAINTSLYPKLPYDTQRDFIPVALAVPPGPMVLAVHSSVPARTMAEFIALARRQPGTLSYASAGIGNSLHLAGEMLSQMANLKMLHVPYRGAAPALNDLAAGQVQAMFNSALVVAPFVKEGRLRLLAQTGLKRSPHLPDDLPTVAESGVPGFEVSGWFGLFAPAGSPPEAVQRLNAETQRAMADPELREKLLLLGSTDMPPLDAPAFAAFVTAETARYARVIKAAGLSLEAPTS